MAIRVVIVDDHPVVRQGLKMMLDSENDIEVCGEAAKVQEAISVIENIGPDVVTVDLSLAGDVSGIELVKKINDRFPSTKSLVLSMHDESLYAERVIRAGARGYVMKKEAMDNVIGAIRKIMKGELFLSEDISGKIIDKLLHGSSDSMDTPVNILANKEFEVFQLLGNGFSSREIADKMSISINTIESHKRNIKEKLKLKNSSELMKHAVQWVLTQTQ